MNTQYNEIIEKHPSTITLDQFYRICHISKRKAKWLLENGIVPCQDSGKKTRRFKIQTIDVVYYLQQLEVNPEEVQPPVGIFNSGYYNHEKVIRPITAKNSRSFKAYIITKWYPESDVLMISDVQQLTGYHPMTISHWLADGKLKSIVINSRRIVAKDWLIDYIVKYTLTHPSYLSEKHKEIISEFLVNSI